MNISDYVARRLLFEVCGVQTPINTQFEPLFDYLWSWSERFTSRYGSHIFYRIPSGCATREELKNDMILIYAHLLHRYDNDDSLDTLKALFVITLYMIIRYKSDGVRMCSEIALDFHLITQNLNSWNFLNHAIHRTHVSTL